MWGLLWRVQAERFSSRTRKTNYSGLPIFVKKKAPSNTSFRAAPSTSRHTHLLATGSRPGLSIPRTHHAVQPRLRRPGTARDVQQTWQDYLCLSGLVEGAEREQGGAQQPTSGGVEDRAPTRCRCLRIVSACDRLRLLPRRGSCVCVCVQRTEKSRGTAEEAKERKRRERGTQGSYHERAARTHGP